MTARQRVKIRMLRLGKPGQEGRTPPPSRPAPWAQAASGFFLAAVLSAAALPGGCTPFAVALVGASGGGLSGACSTLGACFGYLAVLDATQSLRHAATALLVFALSFAFYDAPLFRRGWTMPVATAITHTFTGAVLLSRTGWTGAAVARTALEFALTLFAVRFYRAAGVGKSTPLTSPARRGGLLFLLATVLMALVPVSLYRDISLGRCIGGLAVLTCAWQGGVAAGAVLGTALGSAMDLAGGTPLFAMAWGLAGLSVGLCRGKGRLRAAGTYLLIHTAVLFCAWNPDRSLGVIYEAALTSAALFLLPGGLLRRLEVALAPQLSGPADWQANKLVQERLSASALAFRTLSESLRSAFRAPHNDNDVAIVFDRAAGRVCRTCQLRSRCWSQGYAATFNALNDATPAMLARGRAEGADFPKHFSEGCFHFPAFLAAVNEELTALLYRRQYNARIRESRAAVCRQYAQLSGLLSGAAADLDRELTCEPAADRRVRQRVSELGLDVRTAVFRDSRGLLRVEAQGAGCAILSTPGSIAQLSALLGVPLRLERDSRESLSLLEQEPLMAVTGMAAQKKDGETVSGDVGTYFKRSDGVLFVLLCDGMGSGTEANRESGLAVRLLEQFLLAGVAPPQALATLSSALAMREDELCGFTTVDLLQIDLFSGDGALFKLGAAPTYLKKSGQLQRLNGTSLPAGTGEGEGAPDRFSLHLSPGDTVLLVSDGICGTGEDEWLRKQLADFDGASPKELARALITQSPQGATDDRTALVVRLERRV